MAGLWEIEPRKAQYPAQPSPGLTPKMSLLNHFRQQTKGLWGSTKKRKEKEKKKKGRKERGKKNRLQPKMFENHATNKTQGVRISEKTGDEIPSKT